jgi:hypothetical protein
VGAAAVLAVAEEYVAQRSADLVPHVATEATASHRVGFCASCHSIPQIAMAEWAKSIGVVSGQVNDIVERREFRN